MQLIPHEKGYFPSLLLRDWTFREYTFEHIQGDDSKVQLKIYIHMFSGPLVSAESTLQHPCTTVHVWFSECLSILIHVWVLDSLDCCTTYWFLVSHYLFINNDSLHIWHATQIVYILTLGLYLIFAHVSTMDQVFGKRISWSDINGDPTIDNLNAKLFVHAPFFSFTYLQFCDLIQGTALSTCSG